MSKTLACVLAFVTALMLPLVAGALGLGEIKLNSALNQKLNADIQIVGAASDELDSLQVTLASPAQFKHAGLEYPAVLNKLQFQVVRKSDGTAYLHITSPRSIREPFLDFLIDAKWDNGELLREYTVLLNPPNFETASKPAPAPAKQAAPAPSPTAALVAPESTKPAPKPRPSAAAPSEVKTTPMPAQPAATPAPTPVAAAPVPAAPGLGSNYGPIHRGETLSEIANKMRPSNVTLNQMMIAIYRANPEVFMRNINRMKAGYVMRIPSLSDIQAVSVREANSAVRTQIQEWRTSRGLATSKPAKSESSAATPALQLVAPSSAAAATENQVPGGAEQGKGTVAESKPAAPKPAKSPAEKVTTTLPPPLPTAPAASTHAPAAPVTVKSGGLAAIQSQASKLNKQPENKPVPLPAEKPAATKPPTVSKPAVKKPQIKPSKPAAKPAASGGIVSTLLGVFSNLYFLLAIAVVVVLVFVGVVMKKRFSHAPKSPFKSGPKSTANWGEQEEAGADDLTVAVTTRTKTKQAKSKGAPAPELAADAPAAEESATAEESGDSGSDKTVLVPPPDEAMAGVGSETVKLDDSDPVAEADFHMAYGLYDQAADVLKKALAQDSGRRDVKMKLLEVYFTAGDAANFVDVARGLHDDLDGTADKDWESVAIMGRQVAPDEPLFSATGAESGTSSSVDIALDGGGTETVTSDLDPLAGAFGETQAEPHAGTEILSGTQMLSDGEASSATQADLGSIPAPEAGTSEASAVPAEGDSLEFSLPDLEPEPAAAEAAPEATAESGDAGLEFDLGDLNIEPTPSEKPAASAEAEPAAEQTAVSTDFGTDSQVEFDNALKELSDFVNTNVPPQEEEAPADGGLGAGLSLDGEMPSMTESAAPSEDPGANSLSEVGTKLDLARAYIDMGDPDGAKSILDEVMEEGNAQQKQEAQELMQHLG